MLLTFGGWMCFSNISKRPNEWKFWHVWARSILAILFFDSLKLMPVLLQHGNFHLEEWLFEFFIWNMIQILCLTWSFLSSGRAPLLIMVSKVMSAISSKLVAAMSRQTVPFNNRERNSNREWRERVATWGLLHRFPPSSTSSSNFTHLKTIFKIANLCTFCQGYSCWELSAGERKWTEWKNRIYRICSLSSTLSSYNWLSFSHIWC